MKIFLVLFSVGILLLSGDYGLAQSAKASGRKTTLKRIPVYSFYAAFAFKKKKLSICNKSSSPSMCIAEAQNYYALSHLVKGRCNKIKNDFQREFCEGFNQNCSGMGKGVSKDMCKAITAKDVDKISELSYLGDWAFQGRPMDPIEAQTMLAILEGFKTGRASSCLNALDKEYYHISSAACKALLDRKFSPDDLKQMLNNLRKKRACSGDSCLP